MRCGCGRVHTAARPEGARPGAVGYGPNLQAFAVYLMVVHFIPVHRCVELLASLTGAVPSVGFVHGVLTRAAGVLTEVDKRIHTLAYAVCCDETPLRVGPRTPNQAERDLRPAKVQQNISGRLTIEKRTKDRYRIRGSLSTAGKHGRNMIEALREAIRGHPWMPPDPTPA